MTSVNSFHTQPKHVSPLYLGLQIDQAEHEGYSVFVVLPSTREAGPSSSTSFTTVFNLPHSRADDVVAELAQEARAVTGHGAATLDHGLDLDDENLFVSRGTGPEFVNVTYAGFGGAGNEDEELNRAIEASLQGYQPPQAVSSARSATSAQPADSATSEAFETDDSELAAAIAASLADSNPRIPEGAGHKPLRTASAYDDIDVPSPDPDEDEMEDEEKNTETDASKDTEIDVEVEEERAPTAEELRLKRLARFG